MAIGMMKHEEVGQSVFSQGGLFDRTVFSFVLLWVAVTQTGVRSPQQYQYRRAVRIYCSREFFGSKTHHSSFMAWERTSSEH
jgi:hypothetical protein